MPSLKMIRIQSKLGNRYSLHIIPGRIQQNEGFTTRYIDATETATMVSEIFTEVWGNVYTSMEKRFADSYPAHIFKNVGHLRTLES